MGDAPDFLAAHAYRLGVTPLEYAIDSAATYILLHHEVQVARLETPGAFPGIDTDADQHYWARRLVAVLLDAGWSLPQVDGGQSHSVV